MGILAALLAAGGVLLLVACGGGGEAGGGAGGPDEASAAAAAGETSGDRARTPEVAVLGRGVVSTAAPEFGASLTPDGRTLYFNRASGDRRRLTVMASARGDAGWGEPRVASFSGTHRDLDAFVAPHGRRIWFNSDRPAPGGGGDFDMWYVERPGSDPAAPVRPGAPLNSDSLEMFTSSTRDGTLYFTSRRDGEARVYRARRDGRGGWGRPEPVALGSTTSAGNPLVDPDGAFLVVTGPGPDGSTDLFVSCRRESGWGEPVRLPPPVNSPYADFAPGLDPAAGTLLFTSERPAIVGPRPDSVRPPGDLYRSSLRPAELCG